ncbi:MAG: Flp pilus assembly protein CpaB [Chloroflexi bacterium]|nr:Flp pilus assembly protein CpaB [Chloroflexota bacterium]
MASATTAQSPAPALGGRKALFGALILGAIAAGLIVAFLASRDNGNGTNPLAAPISVVVASQDIAAGTVITNAMVQVRDIPKELVVAGSMQDVKDVAGVTARYPIAKGEQVNSARLVEAAKAKTLSVQIPVGLRGFTIPVEITRSPAALAAPGDFVDVIVSGDLERLGSAPGAAPATLGAAGSGDKPKAVVTLLQNVQVLTVQRNYADNGVVYDSATRGNPPGEKDDVTFLTLAVTPEQAQLLWLASQEGKVTVSLRAFGDDKIADLGAVAEPIRIK